MKKYILIFIFIFFILVFCIAFLQNTNNENYNVLMYKNNEQRTGFYDTAGVPVLHGIKWKYKGNAGACLIYKGILFARNESFDSETGRKIAKYQVSKEIIYNNMLIGHEMPPSANPYLSACSIENGTIIWANIYIESFRNLLIHKDILYVVSRYEGGEDPVRYVIYLVNPMTGEILEEIEPNLHIYGIAFWEDNFIFTSGDGLYKIDFSELNKKHIPVKIFQTKEGEILHKNQKEAEPNATETLPVISNNCVYFGDYIGNFFSLNLKTNKINWQRKFENSFYSGTSASIYDGIVYLINNHKLYYLKESNGDILFYKENEKFSIGNDIAVTRDGIYFASDDGILYAFDRKTGKELWNIKLAKRCIASPIISNGVIYIPAFDSLKEGYMFAIY